MTESSAAKRIDFDLCILSKFASVVFGSGDRNLTLEPADSFVIGDEIIRALRGRIVHVVGRADNQATRVVKLRFVRHRRVPADGSQALVLPCQCHTTVLRPQRHRRIIRLSGERCQRSVARVIEAAQTFENMIGDNVR